MGVVVRNGRGRGRGEAACEGEGGDWMGPTQKKKNVNGERGIGRSSGLLTRGATNDEDMSIWNTPLKDILTGTTGATGATGTTGTVAVVNARRLEAS